MNPRMLPIAHMLGMTMLLAPPPATAAFDPSNVNPCDHEDDLCSHTGDTLPANDLLNTYYGTQSHHMMVGSRFPLKPYTESLPKLGGHGASLPGNWNSNWQLSPLYDSDIRTRLDEYGIDPYDCDGTSSGWSSARPNEFDTIFIQGIYEDDMWSSGANKEDDFTNRTIFMVGAHAAGVASIDADIGESMPSDPGEIERFKYPKYALGAINQGVLLRGGRFYRVADGEATTDAGDIFIANGTASFAWLAYSAADGESVPNAEASAGSTGPPLNGSAFGSQSHAFVGKRISGADSSDGSITTGLDVRNLHYKESDKWAPGSAIVQQHYGALGGSWLDMALTELQVVPGKMSYLGNAADFGNPSHPDYYAGRGRSAGYIDEAVGVYGWVGSLVRGSYVNVNNAYGVKADFNWPVDGPAKLDLLAPDSGKCEEKDPCLSVIRDLTMISDSDIQDGTKLDPNGSCEQELVANSTGLLLYDPIPNSGGGVARNTPYLVASFNPPEGPQVRPTEKRMGIINRGDTVLGDGVAGSAGTEKTGYDTDVVHVRDVIHLLPRTAPPEVDRSLSAADRAGLMYFDASRGTLRVSVPFRGAEETASSSWQDDAIAWVDLSLNVDSVRPHDIVLNNPQTLDPARHFDAVNYPEDGGPAFREFVSGGIERAAAEARGPDASSPYIAPAVLVASAFDVGDGECVATVRVSGFRRLFVKEETPTPPEIHYYVKNRMGIGRETTSPWQVANVFLTPTTPEGVEKRAGDEFYDVVITSPEVRPGAIVYLMAINPDNAESTGTSFVVGNGGKS